MLLLTLPSRFLRAVYYNENIYLIWFYVINDSVRAFDNLSDLR